MTRVEKTYKKQTTSEEQLKERLKFETLLADISARFVNVPAREVDHEIMDAERRICEFLDLDLAALWQSSEEAPDVLYAHPRLRARRSASSWANGRGTFPLVCAAKAGEPHGCHFFAGGTASGGRR